MIEQETERAILIILFLKMIILKREHPPVMVRFDKYSVSSMHPMFHRCLQCFVACIQGHLLASDVLSHASGMNKDVFNYGIMTI